jgi:signal transduction histidine kinase
MPSLPPTAFRTPLESATLARVTWLIGMRWLFILAIVLGAAAGSHFHPDLPLESLLQLGALGACYNLLLHFIHLRLAPLPDARKQPIIKGLIQVQVLADWLVLLAVIHWTGGIESPLLHFFIFHLALSAVFLSPGFTILALAFIITATSLLFAAEATGLLAPVALRGLTSAAKQQSWPYILNFCFWYFSTLVLMALLLGSVMRSLRRREEEALRIRQRLEKANEELRRAGAERIRLMHSMGHELRSPLAAAQSMLSALELSHGLQLPTAVRGILGRVAGRLAGLTGLIGELLELAEERRGGAVAARRVELGALLEGLLEEYGERAREQQVALALERRPGEEACVSGDPARLRRVFENLLSNAVKYSRPGGAVRVGLRRLPVGDEEPGQVEVAVADEGIGIAADQLPRLFAEFYRTPQSRRHTAQGTGLGLAITRDLVEAAGGRILVESELERGSTFRVLLPRVP